MRIALIGSHNTGKTTVFKMLKEHYGEQFTYQEEPIRIIKDYNYNINEQANDTAQLALSTLYMSSLIPDNSILDRSILDNYVYALYLNGKHIVGANTVNFLFDLCLKYVNMYDILFYFPVEFDIKDDGFRSTDKQFQKDIDTLYRFVIRDFQIRYIGNFIFLSGSSKTRFNTILKEVSIYETFNK